MLELVVAVSVQLADCCCVCCCCCRGYANISVLESVVANYSAAGLPLESLWVDIEYMASRFKTMTFDPGVLKH